jgi:hypothetical protein
VKVIHFLEQYLFYIKSDVLQGVTGSFIQVCHGKEQLLKKLQQNDWFVFYSLNYI